MKTKTRWAVGLLFNSKKEVALIAKSRPHWQAGKLNAIGGRIEEGETPLQAIEREFLEEAGVDIKEWREFALLHIQDGDMHCFVAHGDYDIASSTDEKVSWYPVSDINTLPILQDLEWLIPLALDEGNKHTIVDYFQSHAE